jgi:hypothetical protein
MFYARKPVVVERYQVSVNSRTLIQDGDQSVPAWVLDTWANFKDDTDYIYNSDWIVRNVNNHEIFVVSDGDMTKLYERVSV